MKVSQRVISDPGSPTLPKTWADWVLDLSICTLFVIGFLLLAFTVKADVTPSTTSVASPKPPVASTIGNLKECPYCHGLFVAKADKDSEGFLFLDHPFVHLPITSDAYFETCYHSYIKYFGELMIKMGKEGAGVLVEPEPSIKIKIND